jgi:hypothetical protein
MGNSTEVAPFEIYAMGQKQGLFTPWGAPVTSWNYAPPQPLVFVTTFSSQFLTAMLNKESMAQLVLLFWSQNSQGVETCQGGLSFQDASITNCAQYTDPQNPNQSLQKITASSRRATSLSATAAEAVANRVAGNLLASSGSAGSVALHPSLLATRRTGLR